MMRPRLSVAMLRALLLIAAKNRNPKDPKLDQVRMETLAALEVLGLAKPQPNRRAYPRTWQMTPEGRTALDAYHIGRSRWGAT